MSKEGRKANRFYVAELDGRSSINQFEIIRPRNPDGLDGSTIDRIAEQKHPLLTLASHKTEAFLGRNDGRIRFYYFDLPVIITCPGMTEICREHCYEKKIETTYGSSKGANETDVQNLRKRNLVSSLDDRFIDRVVKEVNRRRRRTDELIVIRLHCSGDFYSAAYLRKWLEIALRSTIREKDNPPVFVAYTKSIAIVSRVFSPRNKSVLDKIITGVGGKVKERYCAEDFGLHLIGSVMDDGNAENSTKTRDITSMVKVHHLPLYIASTDREKTCRELDKKGLISGSHIIKDCKSVPCAECMRCYPITTEARNIFTPLRFGR